MSYQMTETTPFCLEMLLVSKHYKYIFCLLNNIEKNIEERKSVVGLQILHDCRQFFQIFHLSILHRFGYRLNENFQSQKIQSEISESDISESDIFDFVR